MLLGARECERLLVLGRAELTADEAGVTACPPDRIITKDDVATEVPPGEADRISTLR